MRILVVDDSAELANTLGVAFRIRWPEAEVICVTDGKAAIGALAADSPDIVILDVVLPDTDGFEVLKRIRALSDVPVIFLSVKGNEVDVIRGLELGADDYIAKPFSPLSLLARMQAVLRRVGAGVSVEEEQPPVQGPELTINFASRQVLRGSTEAHLTPTEYRLLLYLVRNRGRLVTHEALTRQLRGQADVAERKTVKRHVCQLRAKLGDNPASPSLIMNERGIGYRFVAPSQQSPPASDSAR